MRINLPQRNISFSKNEILEQINYYESDIVFISGSLVEGMLNKSSVGMGNCYSDIDVFILTHEIDKYSGDKITYDKECVKAHFNNFKGVSVDIEIYDINLIVDLVKQLDNINFNDVDKRTHNLLNVPHNFDLNLFLSFIHRISNSMPLLNEHKYEDFKQTINMNNYSRLMRRIYINAVDNRYDDVVGNIDSKIGDVAVTVARSMVLKAIGSFIFFKNESIDREKWIPLKLHNIANYCLEANYIYEKFNEMYYGKSLKNNDEKIDNAENLLLFSNEIISKIDEC